MAKTKRNNVLHILILRERGVKCNLRSNLNIMTQLVCCEKSNYVKIWEKHSSKPISYEGGKLYFDNYGTCYSIYGHRGVPQLAYQLPKLTRMDKIEEGLICQCPLDLSELSQEDHFYRGSFLALTSSNYLIRYDIDNGRELQKFYLSNKYKFRRLSWDCDAYTVTLKSTHSKMSVMAREAGITSSLLMALAVFSVFPLKLIGMMEITKKIFGNNITDAMISHGILIVMLQGGLVRLYSFQHILQMGKLNSPTSTPSSSGNTLHSTGLPLNIILTECPPLLFEVRCSEHNLRLGGIPWHYIITPPGARGCFKVYDLDNKKQAEDGYLDMDIVSIEPDKCLFHPDDSGRILHVGSKQIQVLKLTSKENHNSSSQRCKVDELFTIEPFSQKSQEQIRDTPLVTSSGRAVKRKVNYCHDMVEDSYDNITTVDYENDLDILFIGLVCQGQSKMEGKVHLYDNCTGELIKEIVLQENWKEFCDHIICLDLDTLVHIVKAPMRSFSCYVYRLQRDLPDCPTDTKYDNDSKCRKRVLEESLLQDTNRRSRRTRPPVSYEET